MVDRHVLVRAIAVAATLATVGTVVTAAGACSAAHEEVVAKLQSWLDSAATLAGRFEQRLVSGALGDDVVENGRLWIRRPGAMRWDYADPEHKVAIVRDGRSMLYIEQDRQLIDRPIGEEGRLLVDLLAGDRPLDRMFEITPAAPDEPVPPDGEGRIRLRPLAADGSFESVTLDVRLADGAIVGARVHDAAGNVMDYRFRGFRRDRQIPDDTFEFVPPPGTEVLTDQ